MHGKIEIDTGVAESFGIKDGDTKEFKVTFGREKCGGNAQQRRAHRRKRNRGALILPFTVRVLDMHYNAELCGGPLGPSERAPGYASALNTEE